MAFRWSAFEAELKKDNGHFERFKKSSLHDLVELLKRKMPVPTPAEVAAEMKKVPAKKWLKYKRVKAYLEQSFPAMKSAAATGVGIGPSVPGYQPGKWERTQDDAGGWHEFVLQNKGNSCGPACVLMMKTAVHPNARHKLSETEIRGIVALHESGKANTGVSSLGPEAVSAHDWVNAGSDPSPLIKTLQGQPHAIVKAKGSVAPADQTRKLLNGCSTKKPAIVGWWWDGGGGHWTVCVGPSKDGTKLRILDPWNGMQYLDNTDAGIVKYSVVESGAVTATGWMNPNDPSDVAVILCE